MCDLANRICLPQRGHAVSARSGRLSGAPHLEQICLSFPLRPSAVLPENVQAVLIRPRVQVDHLSLTRESTPQLPIALARWAYHLHTFRSHRPRSLRPSRPRSRTDHLLGIVMVGEA